MTLKLDLKRSRELSVQRNVRSKIERTIDLYFILVARNSLLAIMYRSRWVNEVDDILIVLMRREEEGEEVLVQAHGGPSETVGSQMEE